VADDVSTGALVCACVDVVRERGMAEQPDFPVYFLYGLLRSANWPRRVGMIAKKEVVDPRVVDTARVGLAELGVGLGAGSPALAARLLADIFRDRDWNTQPLSELLPEMDPSALVASQPAKLPWQALVQTPMAQEPDVTKEEYMPWDLLADRSFRLDLYYTLARGLMWGILHPNEANAAYEGHARGLRQRLPMIRHAGLVLDPGFSPPTLPEWIDGHETIVLAYEKERRRLVALPAALAQAEPIAARLKAAF